MMKLELTDAETAFLKQVLDNKQTALLNELAHTDDREYRTYVKGQIATLELVQAKLNASVAQGVRAPG